MWNIHIVWPFFEKGPGIGPRNTKKVRKSVKNWPFYQIATLNGRFPTFEKRLFLLHIYPIISSSVWPAYTQHSRFLPNHILQLLSEGIVDISLTVVKRPDYIPKPFDFQWYSMVRIYCLDLWTNKSREPQTPLTKVSSWRYQQNETKLLILVSSKKKKKG